MDARKTVGHNVRRFRVDQREQFLHGDQTELHRDVHLVQDDESSQVSRQIQLRLRQFCAVPYRLQVQVHSVVTSRHRQRGSDDASSARRCFSARSQRSCWSMTSARCRCDSAGVSISSPLIRPAISGAPPRGRAWAYAVWRPVESR